MRVILSKTLIAAITLSLFVLFVWGRNSVEQQEIWVRQIIVLLQVAIDVTVVGVLLLCAAVIGRRIIHALTLPVAQWSALERGALYSGLGLGIIAAYALLAGMAGFFNATALWVPVIVVLLMLYSDAKRVFCTAIRRLSRISPPQTRWGWFALIVGVGMVGLSLMIALSPPNAWDGMTYHLLVPERYLADGRITTHTDTHFFGFPQQIEVLYGMLMAITPADTAPALLHWAAGMLAAGATISFAERTLGRRAGIMTALLLITSAGILQLAGIPYVDLVTMLYGALLMCVLAQWDTDRNTRWLIVVGLIAGFALGTKYTAGCLIVGAALALTVRAPSQVLRNGIIAGAACALAFAPWLLKGTLLYENPVYPYFFNGAGWDDLKADTFNLSDSPLAVTSPVQWVTLPLSASAFGREQVSPYGFTIGPWLLTLPLFLPLFWRGFNADTRRLAGLLALIFGGVLIFWYGISAFGSIGAQPRLILAGVPVAAVLGVLTFQGIDRLPRRPFDVSFLIYAMLCGTILITGLERLHNVSDSRAAAYLTGAVDRHAYLRTNLGLYYPALQQLETLPAGSTVRFMWEPKGYYCPSHITCLTDTLFDHWAHPQLTQGLTPDELMQQWRDAGEYLLVIGLDDIDNGFDLWLEVHEHFYDANRTFPDALAEWTDVIWSDDVAYTLHAFKE